MGKEIFTAKSIFVSLVIYSVWSMTTVVFSQANYAGVGMRDPFESQIPEVKPEKTPEKTAPPEKVKPPPVITVESIVAGGPVPQVIIEGKILRIGDVIKGAAIKNITKDGLEILFEGKPLFFPSPSKLLKPAEGGKNVK